MARFTHTAYQIVPYASYVELAEKINARAVGAFAKKTAFFTTGAEAVENAIKIARAGHRPARRDRLFGRLPRPHHDGHGADRQGGALQGGLRPLPGEIFHAPYPSELHGVSVEDSLKALQQLFKSDIDPKRVAAIIFEPVQGEGGFHVAPAAVRRCAPSATSTASCWSPTKCRPASAHRQAVCHGALRRGAGLTTMAKSLAGGMPLSAVCGRAELMDAPAPGGPAAPMRATRWRWPRRWPCWRSWSKRAGGPRRGAGRPPAGQAGRAGSRVPQIAQVRGVGAMIAVEFKQADGSPDPDFTPKVQARALERGLLLLSCGVDGNVIRFLFPLTIPDAVMDEALGILADALLGWAAAIRRVPEPAEDTLPPAPALGLPAERAGLPGVAFRRRQAIRPGARSQPRHRGVLRDQVPVPGRRGPPGRRHATGQGRHSQASRPLGAMRKDTEHRHEHRQHASAATATGADRAQRRPDSYRSTDHPGRQARVTRMPGRATCPASMRCTTIRIRSSPSSAARRAAPATWRRPTAS